MGDSSAAHLAYVMEVAGVGKKAVAKFVEADRHYPAHRVLGQKTVLSVCKVLSNYQGGCTKAQVSNTQADGGWFDVRSLHQERL